MSSRQNSSSSSSSSSAEPSFLDTLSAIFTSTFSQTATSALTLAAAPPPRPPRTTVPTGKLAALGLATGVRLLHDHIPYVRLNPIVTDCHAVSAASPDGRKLNVPKLLAEFSAAGGGGGGGGDSGPPLVPNPSSPTDTESANLSGWTHYTVADALPHPFGLPGSTVLKYTIALRNLPDGIESLVASPGGVTIHGDIRVVSAAEGRDGRDGFRERAEKTLWLQERVEVRCWVGTGWYIQKTLGESHEAAHERFRAWWEEEVRKAVGGGADVEAGAGAGARAGARAGAGN
jgi:hypothetical protein